MSLKTIDKNIKTITTNANKLNILIHDTGMLILAHAKEHGDCTRALPLVKAMPASMRRTMLIAWLEKFSPIRVKLNDDKVGMLKADAKNFVAFNLEAAALEPFYVMAENTPEEKVYDFAALVKMVEGLSARINKAVDEGKVPEGDVLSARALANAVGGLKVQPVKAVANEDTDKGVAA